MAHSLAAAKTGFKRFSEPIRCAVLTCSLAILFNSPSVAANLAVGLHLFGANNGLLIVNKISYSNESKSGCRPHGYWLSPVAILNRVQGGIYSAREITSGFQKRKLF